MAKSDPIDNAFVQVLFSTGKTFEFHMPIEEAKHIARRLLVECKTVIEVKAATIHGDGDHEGMVTAGIIKDVWVYIASGDVVGVMVTEVPLVKYRVEQ